MSLVGTRPPTVDEWDKYELHHRARLATKPGLTGMWQVSGRSNITDLYFLTIVPMLEKVLTEQKLVFLPEHILPVFYPTDFWHLCLCWYWSNFSD